MQMSRQLLYIIRWRQFCRLQITPKRMCHFSTDYNFGASWSISVSVAHFETAMNTPQRTLKIHNNTITMSLHYLVKFKTTQNSRPLPAVVSVEPVVRSFCKKSLLFPFFSSLLENSFSILVVENLSHSHIFSSKLYVQKFTF